MPFINLNSQLPEQLKGLKIYKGIVIDNNDPLHLDRIKCRVPGLYDDQKGDVPWIIPIKYCMFGQTASIGQFGVPPVGSVVCIELQENDANFPVYTGYLMNNAKQTTPGVFQVIDQSGSVLTIDTNEKSASYNHITGTTFQITKEGSFVVNVPKDLSVTVKGNMTANVTGNVNVKANTATIECSGNITHKCSTFVVEASLAQIKCPVQTGNISNSFGSGGTGATISGGIKNSGGSISSNGIVLDSHTHTAPHGETSGPH